MAVHGMPLDLIGFIWEDTCFDVFLKIQTMRDVFNQN